MYVADEIATNYLKRVRIKEGFIAAACPFHKEGNEKHPSFWINRETGKWGCFACPAGSNDLKELLRLLGHSSKKLDKALEELAKEAKQNKELREAEQRRQARKKFRGEYILPESLLGVYDWCPEELLDEGFEESVLIDHDIGYDKTLGRITFPIRDIYGNLIGISGRNPDGILPKYKVYSGRKVSDDGKIEYNELGEHFPDYSSTNIRDHLWRGQHVFHKLVSGEDEQLIIVEGYKAAMWLVQHGWENTVALMGARMSKTQERLIRYMSTETWVFLDNNEAGLTGAKKVCNSLAQSTFPVYLCSYPDYCDEYAQPDDLEEDELEETLSSARIIGGFNRWKLTGTTSSRYETKRKRTGGRAPGHG